MAACTHTHYTHACTHVSTAQANWSARTSGTEHTCPSGLVVLVDAGRSAAGGAMRSLLPQTVYDAIGLGPGKDGRGGDAERSAGPRGAAAGAQGAFGSIALHDEDADGCGCLPRLSRTQRVVGCVTCVAFGALCFGMAVFYIPLLVVKARKFALLFSLGSLMMVAGIALLRGPASLLRGLFSADRLGFTFCATTK